MLIPVVCFTCGLPIGDVGPLWKHMHAARVSAILGNRHTVSTQAGVDAGLQVDCRDILDKLRIRKDCCRTHLISAMQFPHH